MAQSATDGWLEAHRRNRIQLNRATQEPLKYWRWAVDRLKEAFALLVGPDAIDELHGRGPNKGTKTNSLAHYVVACLQKRKELDGVPLPQWRGRIEAVQMVLDYKRQLLSVQPAYEKALGSWPHKARYQGAALSDLRIMPVGGNPNDMKDWSIVHFLSEDNPRAGVGIRADIVAFDEPPKMPILRELRKAAHAGRRSIRIIMETPEHLKEWAELRADYGDSPRRAITRMDPWRAEVRWSLDEVSDRVLPPEVKANMKAMYWDEKTGKARDPIAEARWHGDYTNAEGSTPWGEAGFLTLLELRTLCREPETEVWDIVREATKQGEPAAIAKAEVQFWSFPKRGTQYYIDVDPASGVDDGKHNPLALHVSEMGTGNLVARWNGYMAPFSVGVMAATLARQYNDAVIDIEMMDHWGVNVVRGCEASRYGNLAHEQRELRLGVWAKEVGFKNDGEAKAIIIGQIREWLDAWHAGRLPGDEVAFNRAKVYAECPSREVIECLIDAELDEREKVISSPGVAHFEDGVLWGQKLRKAVARHNRAIPQPQKPPPTADASMIALMRGKQAGPHRKVLKHRAPPR